MKIIKTLAVTTIFLAIFLAAGCQEETKQSGGQDIKQARLIAAENSQLKEQLQQCSDQLQKQKDLVTQCNNEKEAIAEKYDTQMKQQVNEVFTVVIEENAKLKAEIETLNAKIKQLKP